MKPCKVVHFVFGGGSGATRKAEELAIGSKKRGKFEPYLLYRGPAEPGDRVEDNGVNYSQVSAKSKIKMIGQITEKIKDINPEIMVAHGYREHVYGRIGAIRAGVPVVIQVEHNSQPYNPIYYIISQFLTLYTDKIICVSEAVKDHLIKRFFNEDKMEVIYNGFYVEDYFDDTPLSCRKPGVVMVARFSSQKDHETLIEAAQIMLKKGHDFPIYLVGAGKEKYINNSKKLCKKLGVQDIVHFLGRRDDVHEILANHQISVLSTHYEGLSGVVMEGMAAGNIVLATDAPGVTELIEDGENGFLIPPEDPESLAQRLITVLKNPEKYSHIVKNAQSFVSEELNVDNMVNNYEDLLIKEIKRLERKKEKL